MFGTDEEFDEFDDCRRGTGDSVSNSVNEAFSSSPRRRKYCVRHDKSEVDSKILSEDKNNKTSFRQNETISLSIEDSIENEGEKERMYECSRNKRENMMDRKKHTKRDRTFPLLKDTRRKKQPHTSSSGKIFGNTLPIMFSNTGNHFTKTIQVRF